MYIYTYIYIYITRHLFKKVIIKFLQMFHWLLETNRVKKYIYLDYLQDFKNNEFTYKKDEKATR